MRVSGTHERSIEHKSGGAEKQRQQYGLCFIACSSGRGWLMVWKFCRIFFSPPPTFTLIQAIMWYVSGASIHRYIWTQGVLQSLIHCDIFDKLSSAPIDVSTKAPPICMSCSLIWHVNRASERIPTHDFVHIYIHAHRRR